MKHCSKVKPMVNLMVTESLKQNSKVKNLENCLESLKATDYCSHSMMVSHSV
jgi:hypothetical protein